MTLTRGFVLLDFDPWLLTEWFRLENCLHLLYKVADNCIISSQIAAPELNLRGEKSWKSDIFPMLQFALRDAGFLILNGCCICSLRKLSEPLTPEPETSDDYDDAILCEWKL